MDGTRLPDDQGVLLSEIQRFRKGRDLWRAIGLAALVLVFVVLIPFTIVFWRVVETRRSYTEAVWQEAQHLRQQTKNLTSNFRKKPNWTASDELSWARARQPLPLFCADIGTEIQAGVTNSVPRVFRSA